MSKQAELPSAFAQATGYATELEAAMAYAMAVFYNQPQEIAKIKASFPNVSCSAEEACILELGLEVARLSDLLADIKSHNGGAETRPETK